MERGGVTYILSNNNNKVLYVGVTSNLVNRMYEHKNKKYPKSFTAKYNVTKLVYYQFFSRIEEAISQEKYLKGKKRDFKINLINEMNPDWIDLYEHEVLKW